MSKFNIGDTVQRINDDNGPGAKVGQRAKVVSLRPGFVVVNYPGYNPDYKNPEGEGWCLHNTALLHTARAAEAAAIRERRVTAGVATPVFLSDGMGNLHVSKPALPVKPWEPKVGDKGKTRGGKDYEVVYAATGAAADSERFAVMVEGTLRTYHADGRYYRAGHRDSDHDLMKPVKTVYVNLYANGGGYHYKTAALARAAASTTALAVAVPVVLP